MSENSIATWANIGSGQRFIYSGDHIKVKSKWSLRERLMGKLRLTSNLEKIQTYLHDHPDAIQTASRADLSSFKKNIRRIQKEYYQTHWRIYIWIFGRAVNSLCDALVTELKTEIQKRSLHVIPFSQPQPVVNEELIEEEKLLPSLPPASQSQAPHSQVTQPKIQAPPPQFQVPQLPTQSLDSQLLVATSSQMMPAGRYPHIRHDPEQVRQLLSKLRDDKWGYDFSLGRAWAPICEQMTEDEITQLMALDPNGFHLKTDINEFRALIHAMPIDKLPHLIRLMLAHNAYLKPLMAVLYDNSMPISDAKVAQIVDVFINHDELPSILKEIKTSDRDSLKIIKILQEGIYALPDGSERSAKREQFNAFFQTCPTFWYQVPLTPAHAWLKAYDLKEKMKDPQLDALSFRQYVGSIVIGRDDLYLQALASAFLPLMEESDWMMLREMWNTKRTPSEGYSFVSHLLLGLNDSQKVQTRLTQLLDNQSTYKGIYQQIQHLLKLDLKEVCGQAAIRGYFASPLYRQIGFTTFLEHFRKRIPFLDKSLLDQWAQEVHDCDQKIELKSVGRIQDGEIDGIAQSFDLADLLASYNKQIAKSTQANQRALDAVERALDVFMKQKEKKQDQLLQICEQLSPSNLTALYDYLLSNHGNEQLLDALLKKAFIDSRQADQKALQEVLKNASNTEFMKLMSNGCLLRKLQGPIFITFYSSILPQNKQQLFIDVIPILTHISLNDILNELLKAGQIDRASEIATKFFPTDDDAKKQKLDVVLVATSAFANRPDQALFQRLLLYALKHTFSLSETQMTGLAAVVPNVLSDRLSLVKNLAFPLSLEFFLAIDWTNVQDRQIQQEALLKEIVDQYAMHPLMDEILKSSTYVTAQKLANPSYQQALVALIEQIVKRLMKT